MINNASRKSVLAILTLSKSRTVEYLFISLNGACKTRTND
jgi:hypothetical protein